MGCGSSSASDVSMKSNPMTGSSGKGASSRSGRSSSSGSFSGESGRSRRQSDYKDHKFKLRWKVGEQLGAGGFSVVRKAIRIDDEIETIAAVKITNKRKGKQWLLDLEDMKSEVAIMKELKHPHIMGLYDSFFDEIDCVYIVVEHLPGGDLYEHIREMQTYNEQDARDLAFVFLEVLKFCHDNDVVHRDIKPDNMLLTGDKKNIKLADFGFACKCIGNSETLTDFKGTLVYMAPEIICKPTKYGKPVDMWACGVVLFALLGGYLPFETQKRYLDERLEREICAGWPVKSFNSREHKPYWQEVSSEAKDLISKLLTVDSKKRLTAAEALKHPWINTSETELVRRNLQHSLQTFKRFNAKRKFRSAVHTLVVIIRMQRLIGGTKAAAGGGGVWSEVDEKGAKTPVVDKDLPIVDNRRSARLSSSNKKVIQEFLNSD